MMRGEEDAMTPSAFAGIDRAIADVAAGRPVIVWTMRTGRTKAT